MSSSIDSRILSMKFDNGQFEKAAATSMSTMAKLKQSLNFSSIGAGAAKGLSGMQGLLSKINPFSNAKKGLNDLQSDAARFQLGGVEGAVTHVSKSFLAMATVGITALSNITSQAVQSAGAWVKSFTIGPILAGLEEYQTNLQAIQTVQANTDQPLVNVNRSLKELNKFSDQTIYNFGQMARNVGTFTAAGVDLKTSVSSIKGIATMAALSGSTSEQAATAMYQLSQAISSGRVGLQDWNSVVNAGMGGKKLQNALAQTAVAMGTIDKNAVKMVGPMKKLTINGASFRESITAKPGEKPWLSSEVLVNTLASLDGRFSKTALRAELTADGLRKYSDAEITARIATARHNLEMKNGVKYTDAQFKSLMHLSDSAFKSATEVKTLGQVFDIAKETIGSGWSASFQSIFGTLGEAKKTFTALSGTINGYINANALARNKVLHDWKVLGGRTMLIESIKNVWNGLLSVLKPIHEAFRDVFPRKTGSDLRDMTKNLRDFTAHLHLNSKAAEGLKNIFKGVFAALHIVGMIVFGVIKYFATLVGLIATGGDSVLGFTGSIFQWIAALDKFLTKGQYIQKFFDFIIASRAAVFGPIIEVLGLVLDAFAALITDGPGAFLDVLGNIPAAIGKAFGGVGHMLYNIFGGAYLAVNFLLDHMGPLGQSIRNLGSSIAGVFEDAWQQVLDFVASLGPIGAELSSIFAGGINTESIKQGFEAILKYIEPVIAWIKDAFGQAYAYAKPGLDALGNAVENVFDGVPAAIQSVLSLFGALGSALGSIFGGVKTGGAGGGLDTLTASLSPAVSMADRVKNAFASLGQTVKPIMDDLGKSASDFGSSIGHGVATAAKSIAVVGAVIFKALAAIVTYFANVPGPVVDGVKGIFGGLKDAVVALFSGMGIEEALSILNATLMGGVLFTLWRFVKQAKDAFKSVKGFFNSGSEAFGQLKDTLKSMQQEVRANIILKIAGALLILAAALWILSTIPLPRLVASLAALVIGLKAMMSSMEQIQESMKGKSMKDAAKIVLMTAAMVAMSLALIALATAVKIFSSMSPGELAKGLIGVGVAMAALTVMSKALTESGGGGEMIRAAAALLILSVALTAMTGAIMLFSAIDTATLAEGMIKIVATIVALSIAMESMPPNMIASATALLILAGALTIMAGAMKIFGGMSVEEMGKSLIMLGASLIIIAGAMAAMETAMAGATALLVVAAALAVLTPSLLAMGSMDLASIGKALLVLVGVFTILGLAGLILAPVVPVIFALGVAIAVIGAGALMAGAGLFLMAAGLAALAVSGAAGGVALAAAITAIAMTLPMIAAQFGLAMVVLARLIGKSGVVMAQAFGAIIGAILAAITRNIPKLGRLFSQMLSTGLKVIVGFIPKVINAGFKLIIGFLNAVSRNIGKIVRIAGDIIVKFINAIGKQVPRIVEAGTRMIIRFINGLSRSIDRHAGEMGRAGGRLAASIVRGMVTGIGAGIGEITRAAGNLAKSALDKAKSVLHINSPSRVFRDEVGRSIPEGMAHGILRYAYMSDKASESAGNSALDVMKRTMSGLSDVVSSDIDSNPVITPVLDLAKIQSDATKISGLLPDGKMGAQLSYDRAASISADTIAAMEAQFGDQAPGGDAKEISFTQINNSPKAISPVEHYRQTKNLLTIAKEALT